jgi:hypothetical protein
MLQTLQQTEILYVEIFATYHLQRTSIARGKFQNPVPILNLLKKIQDYCFFRRSFLD